MSRVFAEGTRRPRAGVTVVLAVLACACGRGKPMVDPRGDAMGESVTVPAPTEDAGSAPDSTASWTSSIRQERWQDAETELGKLPDAERNKPEVRLARARVARMLGKDAEAVALTEKLEDELPLLRELVAKERALAAMKAGPADGAAAYLAGRPGAANALLAAEAWDRAGDTTKARAMCDRTVSEAKRTRAQEERARALRLRIVTDGLRDAPPAEAKPADKELAAADARWLAIHGLDEANVRKAEDAIGRSSPPKPLTADELFERARVLADAGMADDALRTIDRAATARGTVPEIDRCRARAEALYKARTRYPEAAVAYRSCAAMGGAHAIEDAFLSARAFSRADRDNDAVPAFAAIVQRHPKSPFAEQAEFHLARSHALKGHHRDAAQAFDAYVKHWPSGKERKEADRYRALAHLMAQDHKVARKLLEDLAGGERDANQQGRWMNLAALAALRDGDKLHATARWAEVARSRPLTWPALVARARLVSQGATPPPAIDPAEDVPPGPPLETSLPPPVDTLHRIGLDGDAEEALRTRESSVVGKAQGRGTEALCRAYGELDRGKRRYQIAQQVPGALLNRAPGKGSRWAWECVFPQPHAATVRQEAAAQKLDAGLLWAVMRQESAFDPEVISPAKAVGLLQLMPETARSVATAGNLAHEELWLANPGHNVTLGARYLRELLDKLHGNVPLAVAAYNAGPEAIGRWQSHAKGESIDVFVESIPFLETRGYVVRVMGNLARYGYLDRGEAGVFPLDLDLE